MAPVLAFSQVETQKETFYLLPHPNKEKKLLHGKKELT
jgi:hypothetical protein